MTPLDAAMLAAALALGFYRLICRELDRLDAQDLRRCGVVIVQERTLEAHAAPIGEYMGREIWGNVTFRGLIYEFNRVQPRARREQLAAGELYLEPGLVYVTS